MTRVPSVPLGVAVALLGAGLTLATLIRPPQSSETHTLPAGSQRDEALDIKLSSPVWLRAGGAEDVALELRRDRLHASQEVWLAAAELHAGGAVVTPSARRAGPLGPGDQVTYRWTVGSGSQGFVPMEISVRMQWSSPGEEEILWAAALRPPVRAFLGMDGAAARGAGLLGILAGGLAALIGRKVKAR